MLFAIIEWLLSHAVLHHKSSNQGTSILMSGMAILRKMDGYLLIELIQYRLHVWVCMPINERRLNHLFALCTQSLCALLIADCTAMLYGVLSWKRDCTSLSPLYNRAEVFVLLTWEVWICALSSKIAGAMTSFYVGERLACCAGLLYKHLSLI